MRLLIQRTSSSLMLKLVAVLLSCMLQAYAVEEKVLLGKISSFHARLGMVTTSRKSPGVPQLQCTGGSAGRAYGRQPRAMQCLNLNAGRGTADGEAEWECKITKHFDSHSLYWFDNLRVSCEGYDSPDDRYVLRGSCGVEYELHLSSEAGSTQGAAGNVSVHRAVYYSRQHGLCSWNWRSVAALAIVAGVAATLLYYSLCSKKQPQATNGRTSKTKKQLS